MVNKHFVLFPLLSQGHIFPFLALAQQLERALPADRRNIITLVSTPLNVASIRRSLPRGSAVRLAELPFPGPEHGLPPGLENSDKLPFHLFESFFRAVDSLQPSFERLVSEIVRQDRAAAVCVLADMYMGWTVETAEKLGVFHSVFVTNGAYATAVFSSLLLHPPPRSATDSSDDVPLENYPHVKIPRSLTDDYTGEGVHPVMGFFRRQFSLSFRSGGLLVNTAAGFEEAGMSLLRTSPALRTWAVGPLLWRAPKPAPEADGCIEWLGRHPPASVLYVSFGSQNAILPSQMADLAAGLDASGRPFVWAIRPPLGFDAAGGFRDEWLPEGFERRMRGEGRGFLVHGWAPQLDILSHPSTGAFLSHCGWNSVLESLSLGVPIVGWPLLVDQLFNSRMLEEAGVCVEVARGKMAQGARGGWEGVAKAVDLVMGGTEMRRKAAEIGRGMKAAMEQGDAGGSSTKALVDFLDYFSNHHGSVSSKSTQ